MNKSDRIFVSGHTGMVGSAILRLLNEKGYKNVITRTSKELDLRNQEEVRNFFEVERPDIVFLSAAKVGGINANMKDPAGFLYDNLMIQANVIHFSSINNVKKLCFLGSSCIYPKECPQPIKEEYLLTGPLEPTNEGYALAKISGLRMAQYYDKQYGLNCINPMPCNLYGKNDHFDLVNSHVLSALVKRFVDAVDEGINEISLWGTGIARREFMNVEDLARALLFLMENYNSSEIINVGTGTDITVKELAEIIIIKTGYNGTVLWDNTKPDGMLRKCLDVSKISELGYKPEITLEQGIEEMISYYRENKKNGINR